MGSAEAAPLRHEECAARCRLSRSVVCLHLLTASVLVCDFVASPVQLQDCSCPAPAGPNPTGPKARSQSKVAVITRSTNVTAHTSNCRNSRHWRSKCDISSSSSSFYANRNSYTPINIVTRAKRKEWKLIRAHLLSSAVIPAIECDVRAGKINLPEFIAKCPAHCKETKQQVYGSGVFASISSICNAAIHRSGPGSATASVPVAPLSNKSLSFAPSGVITNAGGKVIVKKMAGQNIYKGSSSNGVRSLSLPKWRESFVVTGQDGEAKRGRCSFPGF